VRPMALKGTGTPGETPRIGGRGKAGQTDALKKVEPRERITLTAKAVRARGRQTNTAERTPSGIAQGGSGEPHAPLATARRTL